MWMDQLSAELRSEGKERYMKLLPSGIREGK
jgi:hypothetical protein